MTSIEKTLFESAFIPSTDTKIYEAVNVKASIGTIIASNNGLTTEQATIYLVSTGGAPGSSNTVQLNLTLRPGDVTPFVGISGQVLENGCSIWAKATAANKIVMRCSGREIS